MSVNKYVKVKQDRMNIDLKNCVTSFKDVHVTKASISLLQIIGAIAYLTYKCVYMS